MDERIYCPAADTDCELKREVKELRRECEELREFKKDMSHDYTEHCEMEHRCYPNCKFRHRTLSMSPCNDCSYWMENKTGRCYFVPQESEEPECKQQD